METLRVEVKGPIATVVIDHPPVNLMTVPMFLELVQVVEQLEQDDQVRVILFRSANPEWFIAHFDVAAILEFPTDAPPPEGLNPFHQLCERLRTMPKATIAILEGRVGGGGSEFALSCDMRFASPDAVLSQPEVALGLIPGGSGTVRLPRLIGRSRALEVILGCDDIDARTAESWGWVNRVLPPAALEAHVHRLATRIADFPAHAVGAAKASVVRAETEVIDHLLAEGGAFDATLSHPETRDAMRHFLEIGGQTPEVERHLGAIAGDLDA